MSSTGEWVTVGLTDGVNYPCDTGAMANVGKFYSLLPGGTAYTPLQSYPHTYPAA